MEESTDPLPQKVKDLGINYDNIHVMHKAEDSDSSKQNNIS